MLCGHFIGARSTSHFKTGSGMGLLEREICRSPITARKLSVRWHSIWWQVIRPHRLADPSVSDPIRAPRDALQPGESSVFSWAIVTLTREPPRSGLIFLESFPKRSS